LCWYISVEYIAVSRICCDSLVNFYDYLLISLNNKFSDLLSDLQNLSQSAIYTDIHWFHVDIVKFYSKQFNNLYSNFLICSEFYPPSVVLAKSLELGAYISSYLEAIYNDVTPNNCNDCSLKSKLFIKYLSV